MASSLFVNSMRYTPRSFRIDLPRVPISIVLPFQERKITKFRMSIMNPGPGSTVFFKEPFVGFLRSLKVDPGLSDTFLKTAIDCVRKKWCYLLWTAITSIYVAVLLKGQFSLTKFNRAISSISSLVMFVVFLYGVSYALGLEGLVKTGTFVTILGTAFTSHKILRRATFSLLLRTSESIEVGQWIEICLANCKIFGMIDDIGFCDLRIRHLDGLYSTLPVDLISDNVVTTKNVGSRVQIPLLLRLRGKIDSMDHIMQLLDEMMHKLSDQKSCHNTVDLQSYNQEESSVVVLLSYFLQVEDLKDFWKLKGKLLINISQLLPDFDIKLLSE